MPIREQFPNNEAFEKALRDWFAGQALPMAYEKAKRTAVEDLSVATGRRMDSSGLLAHGAAALAYQMADAMLAERSK